MYLILGRSVSRFIDFMPNSIFRYSSIYLFFWFSIFLSILSSSLNLYLCIYLSCLNSVPPCLELALICRVRLPTYDKLNLLFLAGSVLNLFVSTGALVSWQMVYSLFRFICNYSLYFPLLFIRLLTIFRLLFAILALLSISLESMSRILDSSLNLFLLFMLSSTASII